jgi:type III pantothenate kinase
VTVAGPVLAIDCGNSRLKWGLHRDGAWRHKDGVPLGAIVGLEPQWRALGALDKIVVSNVAGQAVGLEIGQMLARWPVKPIWVVPKPAECGVVNAYEQPERLGADRWAALIGARALERGACLVVDAGTATTADMLSADGTFTGGAIFPGVSLMKRSLAQHAGQLPLSEGRLVPEPKNTQDAIETGCLLAQAGAVERLHAQMGPGARCLISGGNAATIAKVLRIEARVVDNLVLEGLLKIAG